MLCKTLFRCSGSLALICALAVPTFGGDWPTWRYDAGRKAATPDSLPANLQLLWARHLPEPRPAWPKSQEKLRFDDVYEPVVLGKRMFVGSTVNDSITAYDTDSGAELWRFYTDGPVRFAPVAHQDRLYATSDDGHLYCLNAADGGLNWKVNGAPTFRPIIGNHRLVSTWPSRGGAVLADGFVYFAAGIWPSMGIFVHAVDAQSGEIVWTNGETGSKFVVHPHGAPSFGSVCPQGYLVASGDTLIVPGGRSVPAVFDLPTGKFRYFRYDKRRGDFRVYAGARQFFLAGGRFDLQEGDFLGNAQPQVVGNEHTLEIAKGALVAKSMKGPIKSEKKKDRRGNELVVKSFDAEELWSIRLPEEAPPTLYLKAGGDVFTGGEGALARFDVRKSARVSEDVQQPVWSQSVDGTVASMLAADDKLFVVTKEANIFCYGQNAGDPVTHEIAAQPLGQPSQDWKKEVASIARLNGTDSGFAVAFGIGTGRLIEELLKSTQLHIIAVDPDAKKVDRLRRRMDKATLYGTRVVAHVGDLRTYPFPPYLANLIVAEEIDPEIATDPAVLKNLFGALRPYGGVACLRFPQDLQAEISDAVSKAKLAKAVLGRSDEFAVLTREGSLPGSASWTHHYADAGNSVVSKDRVVKAPLGVLWFGGPANDKILPRHGHGPSPQVAGGRLFIEGPDMLRAVDVYTGRVLWEKELEDVGEFYNVTHHFSGAGEYGSNYVSLGDSVYIMHGSKILELDAANGSVTKQFLLDSDDESSAASWSYITAWNDLLLATSSAVSVSGVLSVSEPKIPEDAHPLVKPFSHWKYLTGEDPDKTWNTTEFNDKEWKEGPAGFGFGDDDDFTKLDEIRGKFARIYVRNDFQREAAGNATEMELWVNFDDAFIAYLNGQEVARAHIKEGSGAEASKIQSHEAEGHKKYVVEDLQSLLKPGLNVIALEGHNSSAGSSDMSLDPYVLLKGEDLEIPPEAIADKDSGNGAPPLKLAEAFDAADRSASSRRLVVFDRHTGEQLWSRDAEYNFRHNSIAVGAGKVFAIDGLSPNKLQALRRRGVVTSSKPRLLALDAYRGREIWSTDQDVFGTFLNYSDTHDVLLQAGSANSDRASDEVHRGMVAYQGADGTELWKDLEINYAGPCLMWNDTIITNGYDGFQLEMLTGKRTGWAYSRMYGCNSIIGSENLLTFRSGAAGFCDLAGDSGTGNLGGFKSSCTSNLIVADGVLNAPDYTRTCSCAYQNQASLAFVHMPDAELWTFNSRKANGLPDQLGVNFGAPGDRRDANGTLWLEYPKIGGPSPDIEVKIAPEEPEWFSQHSSLLDGEGLKWVAASGAKGIESVAVTLRGDKAESPDAQPYKVRLHFVEPENARLGERVFSVTLQGQTVLSDFDIASEAGGVNQPLVMEFASVEVKSVLEISFEAHESSSKPPVLCGIEVTAERP